MPQVGIGEKIPLYLFVEDRNPGLFPRAKVKDPTGAVVGTVGMTSIGDGSYVNDALIMPDKDFVVAEYVVFDDAGFTIESVVHFPTAEVYEKDRSAEVLADSVIPQINQITPPGASIEVDFGQTELESEFDSEDVQAQLDQESIDSDISDNSISVEIDQDDIETEIKEC